LNSIILICFIGGYTLIALESKIKINKAAIALFTGVLVWTIYILFKSDTDEVVSKLVDHLGSISQILFFLIGAMTIVQLIDSYNGFDVITSKIKTSHKKKLLVIIGIITFLLSSLLDNLTTTIVMVTLTRKLLHDKKDRLLFIGMIVIAANAGGAWTPIGDVTTTMLWIGGQITTVKIMRGIFLPSLISMLIPLTIISLMVKGQFERSIDANRVSNVQVIEKNIVFFTGISALMFVPVFKSLTHLPPFMGMLTGLSVLWILTEILNKDRSYEDKITVTNALRKIDIPSILFFLGILMAVSALESINLLSGLAERLSQSVGNLKTIAMSFGILSAIIDNVPLVAAAMGMYDLTTFPPDHYFWELIAYCAGTGGSILIIGSAAGVAAMGIEKLDFIWYMKHITLIALLGYLSGAFLYILLL
jgi:Na+/H+ antiporter NhaD/arsenite permease-like protein